MYKGVSSKSAILGFPWKTIRDVQKKRCLYCYMHQFLEFFDLILVCRPATATILSISAQGSEGRHFMNRFVLASVAGKLGIVIACVSRAASWLLAHGLAPAYEERLGSGTRCAPLSACLGLDRGCVLAGRLMSLKKQKVSIIKRYPKTIP